MDFSCVRNMEYVAGPVSYTHLLVGNTGYITKEFVQEAFPESEVFIMGNSLLKTERKKHLNVRPFPERDEELEDIFHTYAVSYTHLDVYKRQCYVGYHLCILHGTE